MALKEIKYIQIDDEAGSLYSAGKRSLIIPVDFIFYLNGILSQLVGNTSAKILLYRTGQALGEGYSKTLEEILKKESIKINQETLLREAYNAISMQAGWGIISILEFNLKKEKIKIKITNSPMYEGKAKSNFSLEAGILNGAYKKLIGKDLYFSFTEQNKNDDSLIFESNKITPKEFLNKEKMILIERADLKKNIKERTGELENTKKALLNILDDIEEAKNRTEEEKSKTLSIITNLDDGLLVFSEDISDKNNKLILVNPMIKKIFNIDIEKIIGKSFDELALIEKMKPMADLIKKEQKKGKNISRMELNITENLIVEISVVPILRNNENIGLLLIAHDVSREKEIEKIKSEFVSTAAHQLRTPLSAIKWTLQMIINGDLGYISPEQKTFLMQGYQSNERMINLVNDLLNVARIEEGRFGYQFSLIQTEDLIQNIIQDFTHKIEEKKINFIFDKMPILSPKVNIDPSKIRLVIGNLLDNAIKYTPENGKVTILLKYDKICIEISVHDSGIGIPINQQDKLFGKFFRSENAVRAQTEGSGLGLFIVKNVVEKHGGKISFESEENKGSIFRFTIPINTNK